MKTLMLLALLASPALADTLTYQTQTLSGQSQFIDGGGNEVGPINDVYTITVTISGPLAPNLNMAPITPQSWVVTCQNCQQDLSSSPVSLVSAPFVYTVATAGVFLFSTDATGKITAWSFALSGNSTVSQGANDIEKQDSGFLASGDTAISTDLFDNTKQYIVTTSGPKGTWTQSSLSAPAKPAPPAPANTVGRLCTAASNPQWAKPAQYTGFGLSASASGAGEYCGYPGSSPAATYIQVSSDGGKTSSFVTLASLGLGK